MTTADLPAVFQVRTSTRENAVTLEQLEDKYDLTPGTLSEAMNGSVRGFVYTDEDRIVGFAMGDSATGEMIDGDEKMVLRRQ